MEQTHSAPESLWSAIDLTCEKSFPESDDADLRPDLDDEVSFD